ncbi:MAG: hypothetical protein KKA42_02170 [candidate division Zixibacteria bacterium]|nr:hypothetical protein [candidate division Zixibacteria bacterium]
MAVILIDATDELTSQDQRVLAQVMENRRPAVLAINKWDLIEKSTTTAGKYASRIKEKLAKFDFLPIIFISALSGQRVVRVLPLVDQVHEQNHRRIGTNELNDFLQKCLSRKKPPAKMGRYIQFKYVTQSEVAPPTFVFFVNRPEMVDKTYISFLTNQLRAEYGFEGVPIRIKCRRK